MSGPRCASWSDRCPARAGPKPPPDRDEQMVPGWNAPRQVGQQHTISRSTAAPASLLGRAETNLRRTSDQHSGPCGITASATCAAEPYAATGADDVNHLSIHWVDQNRGGD